MKFPGTAVQRHTCMIVAIVMGVASLAAHADDIDVYTASAISGEKPNILFVLDYSGSMGWDTSGRNGSRGNGPSRISVLKSAMEKILDENENTINAGLGSTYSFGPTGIRWPVSDLAADARTVDPAIPAGIKVKEILKQRIYERDANGSTATVDAMVEAAQYFRGDPVTHNDASVFRSDRHQPANWDRDRYRGGDDNASLAVTYSPSDAYTQRLNSKTFYCDDYSGSGGPNFCAGKASVDSCTNKTADDASTPGFQRFNNLWGDYKSCEYDRVAAWETPRFNSPITDSCGEQNNAIVLITDGVPTWITNGPSLNSVLPTGNLNSCEDMSSLFASMYSTTNQGNCAIEIAHSLANYDVYPAVPGSRVKTYTVGFNINDAGQDFLNRISAAGDTPKSYSAKNAEELAAALADIVSETQKSSENFAELSVEVDRASFAHNNRVYYSLFSPSKRRAWQGNLKGYFVEEDGLVGINDVPATDDENNVFSPNVQSFWSPNVDGNIVEEGGVSKKLTTGSRTLYTYVGDELATGAVSLAGNRDNRLRKNNRKITNLMMGLAEGREGNNLRKAALDWIQNAPMGDPLHSKSVGVNYKTRQVRYAMTNQGLLHAFDVSSPTQKSADENTRDTSGGDEIFAFMPKRLLKNLPALNGSTSGEGHIYGLDGGLTRFHDDVDNNGIVNDGEKVTLFFGMRRGGSAYYSMDVSKPERPKLNWVIDENTTGFDRLAQTWSSMSMIQVAEETINGTKKRRVLAFAAGYDAAQQDDVNAAVESKGNAIYMVDEDGTLLLTIDKDDHEDMKYSIASDLTIIDSNNDQMADRIYVGDLAGQVWRIDFDDPTKATVTTRLANLADTYHQPFFYPPSVSLNGESGNRFLAVTLGSGNRTSPNLKDTRNNFYMIRDTDVEKGAPAISPYPTVTANTLYDATENAIQSSIRGNVDAAKADLKAKRGWRVKLDAGEKSLSSILTFDGKVMATTFVPGISSDENVCGTGPTAWFYVMDVNDASVVDPEFDDSPGGEDTSGPSAENGISKSQRRFKINTKGIPSGPVAVLTKNKNTGQIFVDREVVDTFNRALTQVYWHAR